MSRTPMPIRRERVNGGEVVAEVRLPVVRITPQLAERWLLERNRNNRRLRTFKVEQYAADMAAGRWREGRTPIEFAAEDGRLLDGQHRLAAIVKSGVTIDNPVKGNVPLDDLPVIDTGLARLAADVLSFEGHQNASQLAAAAKVLMAWEQAPSLTMLRGANRFVTHETIRQYVVDNPLLEDSVKAAHRVNKAFNLIPPSVVAAVHYAIMREHGLRIADEFFNQLAEGYGLEQGSPILALRSVLMKSQTSLTKPPTELRMAWTIHAFNKWATNETEAKLIKHNRGWDFPNIISKRRFARTDIEEAQPQYA